MNCQCGHTQDSHGQRMARRGAPRTLARACRSCACEQFVEASAQNSDRMSDDDLTKRALDLERRQRQLQLEIQAFKVALKNRAASREQASR